MGFVDRHTVMSISLVVVFVLAAPAVHADDPHLVIDIMYMYLDPRIRV